MVRIEEDHIVAHERKERKAGYVIQYHPDRGTGCILFSAFQLVKIVRRVMQRP